MLYDSVLDGDGMLTGRCSNPKGNPKCSGFAGPCGLCTGCVHYRKEVSADTRQKIREKATGRVFSEESRKQRSELSRGSDNPFFGKTHSKETIGKIRAANIGKKLSAEHRAKLCGRKGPRIRFSQWSRICSNPKANPCCKGVMYYPNQAAKNYAERRRSVCPSCRRIGAKATEAAKAKISAAQKALNMTGSRNHFYGKRHSEDSKKKIGSASVGRYFGPEIREKMSLKRKGKKLSVETRRKIAESRNKPEFKVRMSARFSGQFNPFFGKTHAKETRKEISALATGRKATDETKRKMSLAKMGKRNHMFGKPCSKDAAWAVGGRFNGIYFRSSSELAFLMAHREIRWKSAEVERYRVAYLDCTGNPRNHFADFYGDGWLIEVKPPGWDRDTRNQNVFLKLRAASAYCNSNGLSYVLAEIPSLAASKVFKLRDSGVIALNKRWERRFQLWKSRR